MTQAIRKYIGKAGYALLSTFLAFHVFSVFMAPAAMPPASPLLMDGYRITVPYTELMFLNHGYHFFAPDPGASSLISWKVTRSGDVPVSGRFPDPSTPRGITARHSMQKEISEIVARDYQLIGHINSTPERVPIMVYKRKEGT